MTERTCGRDRRETTGIISKSKVRTFTVENLRVPEVGSSAQGKSGPKERPKGVSDGQWVDNPIPPKTDMREVGTQKDKLSMQLRKHV